ncbi:MAG: pyridoxal phosphate-dependent aminotransferase [Acidobacteriota bacterium]
MLRISGRMREITSSCTFSLKVEEDRIRSAGQDIIDFGAEEPDFNTPDNIKEAAKRSIDENFTHHTDPMGLFELRKAIAERYTKEYGTDYPEREILVANGARNVLLALALSLFGEGDEAIVLSPHWSSYPEQVRIAGARPVFAKVEAEDRFLPRAERIEEAITSATKAIFLNSPCNPSGSIIPSDLLKRILVLSLQKDFYIISDESYESFIFDGRHESMMQYFQKARDRLILVNSLSMTYAMSGWRIGYAIGPKAIIDAAAKIVGHDSFHPSSVSQKAALEAMRGESAVASMLNIYRERRDCMLELIQSIKGMTCHVPEGAFYLFPNVTELCRMLKLESSLEVSNYLFKNARVITVPGEVFGYPGHIRLTFAASLENIMEGMKRIRDTLCFRA